MTGTFKAVDGEEIDAELDRRLSVADCGAFMEDGAVSGFELLDKRARIVAGSLDNGDAFVNNGLRIAVVIGRNQGGKKGEVDAERVFGHLSTSLDLFPEVVGGRLGQGG